MSVTLLVSKLSGWLNDVAPSNMYLMDVTRLVSKLSGWLNDVASRNMPSMDFTLLVFHLEISSLKPAADVRQVDIYAYAQNRFCMLVTKLVSHTVMFP
eukprot:CAMPEP_0195606368 /NCGR_PEP_ID=MMETSP0815-20121206/7648_1 /TAXON_ID=97485 /ORGANISM="Prymnesium parvum, Strain Texoma1" /LENGTH=97 /DNA_ID=CAMNT_0040746105 /DNA_START=262 /DNA_END=555 /DNA_ORIENTATION=-